MYVCLNGKQGPEYLGALNTYRETTTNPAWSVHLNLVPKIISGQSETFLKFTEQEHLIVAEREDLLVNFDRKTHTVTGSLVPSRYGLESVLKILAATTFDEFRRLFLHSVGVRVGDFSYLFLGHSEVGKTTISRLTPGDGIYSDEWNCIVLRNSQPYLVSSPFLGEGISPFKPVAPAPLRAIAILQQAQDTSFKKLSPSVGMMQILDHSPLFGRLDSVATSIFEIVGETTTRIPTGILSLRKGDLPWLPIESVIG